MGTVIENEKTKEKCQIFTPDDIVKSMLDQLGYSENLYGKKILENSCGNGQFLKEIVRRYIEDCQKNGLSRTKIRNGLVRDIWGIELDPIRHKECLDVLNCLTDSYNLKRVSWQIKQADALREPYIMSFDFVIGNPPYVSYWDLEISEREYVENNYSSCKFGAWDYSYAFLENGFNHLKSSGKMSYIIPNSIFKTKSGKYIRNLLYPYLTEICDYTTTKVFKNVLTSPTIITIDKSTKTDKVLYKDLSKNQQFFVGRTDLSEEWLFDCVKRKSNCSHRFGDYFKVTTGIATQRNEVFVLKDFSDDDKYLINGDIKIEKDAVREACSPRSKSNGVTEYIIFPYYYSHGKLNRYSENGFKTKFPFTYAYLESKKESLDERAADKNAQWFEYGRSQALTHINQDKLLLSTVITETMHVYLLGSSIVPYSGLFITAIDRPDALSLSKAIAILTSDEFMKYLKPLGINVNGRSIRIVAKNIENYCW